MTKGRLILGAIIALLLFKGIPMLKQAQARTADRLAERRKIAREGPRIPMPGAAQLQYDSIRRAAAARVDRFDLLQAGIPPSSGGDQEALSRAVREITRHQRTAEAAMFAKHETQAWRDSVIRDANAQIQRIRREVTPRRP